MFKLLKQALSNRYMKFFYLICIYLLLTIILTFPSVLHLTDKIIGDGGDNYQFLSFQYLAHKELKDGNIYLGWTNYWRFPSGFNFSISYDSTVLLFVGIILYRLINDPIIVFNLSVLFLVFLNGILSYISFKGITNDKILGIVGSITYGYSFFTLSKIGGHVNLILNGSFPFFIYSIISIYKYQGRLIDFIKLSMAITLIYFSSLQYLLILVCSLILLTPFILVFYKNEASDFLLVILNKKWSILITSSLIVSIFIFFNFEHIIMFFTNTLILPSQDIISVPIINYFLPNKYLLTFATVFSNNTYTWIENVVFLGYIEFVILILFLFMYKNLKQKLYLLINILTIFIVSLGDQWNLPYRIFYNYFPFRGVQEANRFFIILYLFLTLSILLFLKSFPNKVIIWLFILFIVFERLPRSFYLNDTHKEEPFINFVRSSNSIAVLDLPILLSWDGSVYNLYSTYYQKSIVNGYLHWLGDYPVTRSFINDNLKSFRCNLDGSLMEQGEDGNLISALQSNNIKTLVIHKDLILKRRCGNVLDRIKSFIDSSDKFTKGFEDKNKEVYFLGN